VKISVFGRHALSSCVAAAMLAGCGGSQPPIGAPNGANGVGYSPSHRRTFHYTGKEQSFRVPSGVTQVTIKASGASGPSGTASGYCEFTGGSGGVVKATIPVTPGETLAIYIGGEGTGDGSNCSPGGAGGFNGGGDGGSGISGGNGTGGGGASDVRQGGDALNDRVIVAGGGGGGGIWNGLYGAGAGGNGGGKIGGTGGGTGSGSPSGHGGTGGTQHRGGKGGEGAERSGFSDGQKGHRGKLGVGGEGGGDSSSGYSGGGGGGGGGGYYGGGGGQAGSQATSGVGGGGGGGGGSSYIERGATNVKNEQGTAAPGNGVIVISW
jgi:hypothetical protein